MQASKLFFAAIGFVASLGAARASHDVRICMTDAEHVPWRVAAPDGRMRDHGLDFELIRQVEKQTGQRFRVEIKPGKRCLLDLEAGYVDATVGLSYTPERERFLRFPTVGGALDTQQALRVDRYRLYRMPKTPVHWDGVRLEVPAGGKVGIALGHAVRDQLQKLQVPVDERARSAEMALRMLVAGELAAAALHQGEAEAVIARRPELKDVERMPIPVEQRAYFLVFSKRFAQSHPELMPPLWRAFREATKMDAYQQAVRELSR